MLVHVMNTAFPLFAKTRWRKWPSIVLAEQSKKSVSLHAESKWPHWNIHMLLLASLSSSSMCYRIIQYNCFLFLMAVLLTLAWGLLIVWILHVYYIFGAEQHQECEILACIFVLEREWTRIHTCMKILDYWDLIYWTPFYNDIISKSWGQARFIGTSYIIGNQRFNASASLVNWICSLLE